MQITIPGVLKAHVSFKLLGSSRDRRVLLDRVVVCGLMEKVCGCWWKKCVGVGVFFF